MPTPSIALASLSIDGFRGMGNKYLDRSVLVSTVESAELAFFTYLPSQFPRRRSSPRPTSRSRPRSRWDRISRRLKNSWMVLRTRTITRRGRHGE